MTESKKKRTAPASKHADEKSSGSPSSAADAKLPARTESLMTLPSHSTLPEAEAVEAVLRRPSTSSLGGVSERGGVQEQPVKLRRVGSGKGIGRAPEVSPQAPSNQVQDFLDECYGRSHRCSPKERYWEQNAVTPRPKQVVAVTPQKQPEVPATQQKGKMMAAPKSSCRKSRATPKQALCVHEDAETQLDTQIASPKPAAAAVPAVQPTHTTTFGVGEDDKGVQLPEAQDNQPTAAALQAADVTRAAKS